MIVAVMSLVLLGPLAFAMILLGLTGCCERWLDREPPAGFVRQASMAGASGHQQLLSTVNDVEGTPAAVPVV